MTRSLAASGIDLRAAKRAVRERIVRARDSLPADVHAEASRQIVTTLVARSDFAAAKVVLMTLPFGSEWDTRPLLATALAQGKGVAIPRVNADRRMLDLHAVCDLARDVAPGYRGILEPRGHCAAVAIESIDWILVPGIAFDAHGRRIGYGGGYYDRLLPLLPATALRIAGAFEVQVVDRVPTAPHDLVLDAIVTEARVIMPAR
jgi:5-formyltetrahydrofolate cyclo-ligase